MKTLLFVLLASYVPQGDRETVLAVQDLQVGHWVEVRGEPTDDGTLVAGKVELLAPDEYEVLIGVVGAHDVANGSAQLLGVPVSISAKTEWTSMSPTDLSGLRVRIEGRYRGPSKFSARDIRPRGSGRDRIAGRIDAIDRRSGATEIEIIGLRVRVGPDCEVVSTIPLADVSTIEQRWDPSDQLRNVDEDDLLDERYEIAPGIRVGGQIEVEQKRERDFDLDDADRQDRIDTEVAARVRAGWIVAPDLIGRVEGRFRHRWRDDQDDGNSTDDELRFGETWLMWRDALGGDSDLTIGRQDFDDPREWIYDQNLDGVRARRREHDWRWELALTTTLGAASKRDEGALDASAYLSNLDEDRHLAAWFVHRDLDDGSHARLSHFGVRALGDWLEPFDVWAELSGVVGREFERDVAGYAYDFGFVAHARDWPVALAAGWAYGSGDDGFGSDGAFRQTGLQDNNGKLGTATSIRYYGELVDPELSNLRIATLGLSWWVGERTTLALVWHDFAQATASTSLRDSQIDVDPTGIDRHLGSEVDLVLGSRAIEDVDFELAAGVFFPGAAFVEDDPASFVRVQVRYRF